MATSGSTTPSLDDLSDFVATFVKARFEAIGSGITGAVIAEAVRHQFPQVDLKELIGEHWLADVVRHAAASGKIVRNHAVKHLEAFPPTATRDEAASTARTGPSPQPSRVYVKPDLWQAFVFVNQSQPRLFRKSNQQVIPASASHTENDGDMVEIHSISSEVQKEWMNQFVASRDGLAAEHAPIEAANWWIAFPQWLRSFGPSLEQDWRRFRTDRVVEHIRVWAKSHGIPDETILIPAKAQRHRELMPGSVGSSASLPAIRSEDALRKALLASVSDMTLDELRSLSIPVRCILRHFDPR